MEESVLNRKVLRILNEFEAIEDIQPSADWNQSLMKRLSSPESSTTPIFNTTRYAAVILLFVLVNLGFILNSILGGSFQTLHNDKELMVIATELFVNPISINN